MIIYETLVFFSILITSSIILSLPVFHLIDDICTKFKSVWLHWLGICGKGLGEISAKDNTVLYCTVLHYSCLRPVDSNAVKPVW